MARPVVLAIGGSDSGAGAGIQADIRTAMALGGHAATVITAITAQNMRQVRAVEAVSAAMVAAQFRAVLEDGAVGAIKLGMLGTREVAACVADLLAETPLPVVLDPVLRATSGASLLAADAIPVLRARLWRRATLVTPNVPEAEFLLDRRIRSAEEQREAARHLLDLGAQAVLLKGGHLEGAEAADILATQSGIVVHARPRLAVPSPRGTGCTLATAIAVGLAAGLDVNAAVARARDYVQAAIAAAPL